MIEAFKGLGDGIVWLAGVVGAVITLAALMYKWAAKPIKKVQAENKSIISQNESILEGMGMLTDDVGDILCDRLNQAHDYWVKKGYCPKADKTRLLDMYERYTKMGRNHLVENYAKNLMRLPEEPPAQSGRGAAYGDG